MAECQRCGEEADSLTKVKDGKKALKVCEACAEDLAAAAEVADEAEGAMQSMMEYKGRR